MGVGKSVIVQYYAALQSAVELYESGNRWPDSEAGFRPSPGLPELTEGLVRFYEPAQVRLAAPVNYRGHSLSILDLMCNPATRTTKTLPSLVIAARAVAHIRSTGERVMIVTPSSGNKGTALRDAVQRAIKIGLVSPDELSVTVLVPEAALPKLWSSPLAADPELRRRNPVLLYPGPEPDRVKALASEFVRASAERYMTESGVRLWFTLDLANYIVADAARAFAEADLLPPEPDHVRTHAHAVSSAFGLLGYHLGRRVLNGDTDPAHPRFLLIQQLRTPDMVLSLERSARPAATAPTFTWQSGDGYYVQRDDPSYPQVTDDPNEEIDSTFYTRRPATSAAINKIVAAHGGGGIVVSRRECQDRYDLLRGWLADADIELPADQRNLREWSLVMVLTGVLNAIDRGLLPTASQVVVHASGSYGVNDYTPLPASRTSTVSTLAEVSQAVELAASP
jgi:Family of unknown function (DUF6002)